jgi:hypothetical protein
MPDPIQWEWSDGWILMAIFLAGGKKGALLEDVIASADATNHAIPTTRELSGAMAKFLGCGLVALDDDRWVLSRRMVPEIKKAYARRGGLFAAGDKGLTFLKRSRLPCEPTDFKLTDATVKRAYRVYLRKIGQG